MDFYTMYGKLIDLEFFTEEELALVTSINGDTIETLEDCIYARYGLRSYQQLVEEYIND